MPLIILTGYPCSGLSYRAQQLASKFKAVQDEYGADSTTASKSRYKIHVVSSHDSSHPRTVYDNARTEKEARGVAYTRAKRALGRDSIVILDGMNYIKGYRYQLWCEAKAAGTTCCVVHVGTPIDQCVANNEARLKRQCKSLDRSTAPTSPERKLEDDDLEEPYPPELLNNLIFRYEEPSSHNRWDKPLFTVPWSDPEPPIADIWAALTGTTLPGSSASAAPTTTPDPVSNLSSPLSSSSATTTTTTTTTTAPRPSLRPKIKPHQATVQPTATDPTALYEFEKRTSAIVTAIRRFALANPSAETALAQSPDGTGISIPVSPDADTPVFIPAHVVGAATTDELAGAAGILALPRLQRLRRQWIGLNRAYVGNYSGKGALGVDQVGDAFVRFLNAEFGGESG